MKRLVLTATALLVATTLAAAHADTANTGGAPIDHPAAENQQALVYPILWWTDFPEWFGPILPPIHLACFGPVCGCITVGGIRICV